MFFWVPIKGFKKIDARNCVACCGVLFRFESDNIVSFFSARLKGPLFLTKSLFGGRLHANVVIAKDSKTINK